MCPDGGGHEASERALLVVEDEPVLRSAMTRGLSRLPDVVVYDAANVREARELLERCRPRVIVSDLDLPDGSGVEVAAERERLGLHAPILFVSGFVRSYRARLPAMKNIEVYEKPLAIDALRALVRAKLGPAEAAREAPFGLVDYVQLAGMGRRSVLLEVEGPGVQGQVRVHEGELWSARDKRGEGFEAFKRLAFGAGSVVACRALRALELGPRDLHGDCESVLLEAARVFDEAGVPAANEASDDDTPLPVALEPLTDERAVARVQGSGGAHGPALRSTASRGESFEELYDKGIDALLKREHKRAYALFCEAREARPGDAGVLAKLRRLEELGYGS